MSCKRQWGIEKISSHAIAQHFILEAFCFDSCLQRVYLNYFPGYSSHQSSLGFRHSPDPACLYFSIIPGSEMIWWVVRPPVYSGALITLLPDAPHLLLSCSHDVSPEAPDYVTVSGPLSWLREAMSEIFAEPCIALLSRSWLYLVISEHRLWMRSRPLGHFIQLTQRKRNAISFSRFKWVDIPEFWVAGRRLRWGSDENLS